MTTSKDTTIPSEPDYDLEYCKECGVMTNHLDGKCMKSIHPLPSEEELRELRLFLKACGLGVVDAANAEEIVRAAFATALHEAEVRGQRTALDLFEHRIDCCTAISELAGWKGCVEQAKYETELQLGFGTLNTERKEK